MKSPKTLTIRTPSPNSYHLVYRIPKTFKVKVGEELVRGVEIPTYSMLPGSVALGADGIKREYQIIDITVPPIDAPAELLAVVEAGEGERTEVASFSGEVGHLLDEFARAPSGKRNEVFMEIGIPVLRALGIEKGAQALEQAYPGDNVRWLNSAIQNAAQKMGNHGSFVVSGHSQRRHEVLLRLYANAVLGAHTAGKTGTLDRRVLIAVAQRCLRMNSFKVEVSTGTFAIDTGTQPDHVRAALKRLIAGGLLFRPYPGESNIIGLVCCVQGCINSKGENPLGFSISSSVEEQEAEVIDPLHPVWLSRSLDGRHGHVWALIASGVYQPSRIAEHAGVSRSTISRCQSALEEHGLLVVTGGLLSVGPNARSTANELATRLGGLERIAAVKRRVESDLARLGRYEQAREEHGRMREEEAARPRMEFEEILRQQTM